MWMLTTFGFFSVVQKPGDRAAGKLTIRARVREDLEALKADFLPAAGPITESSSTDYRYRVQASKADVAAAFAKIALSIDYSNFKSAVSARQGHSRAAVYHNVWDALYVLQKAEPPPSVAPLPTRSSRLRANSFGGVLVNDQGQVLLREPHRRFDGYVWTFAKGKLDSGDDEPKACALREVKEETGYDGVVLEKLPGPYKGGTGVTEFFLMRPVGAPSAFDPKETSAVIWVSFDEAHERIGETTNALGRERDKTILRDAKIAAKRLRLI